MLTDPFPQKSSKRAASQWAGTRHVGFNNL
jgi:hypothetical protein